MEILVPRGQQAGVAAILFDLDGTLADTVVDIAAALGRSLARLGEPARSVEEVRALIGEGVAALARRVLPAWSQRLAEELKDDFIEEYSSHCCDRTRLYPGVAGLLATLRDRGLPLAVLSNKPDPLVQRIVGQLCGTQLFTATSGQRPELPPKPDPAGALRLTGLLGVPPGRCLFVGDSAIDLQTARTAGMAPVGVLWGYRGREELARGGALALLSQPHELLDLLELLEQRPGAPTC